MHATLLGLPWSAIIGMLALMLKVLIGRTARLTLALLAVWLGLLPLPFTPLRAAPSGAIAVTADADRAWVETAFLHLEFDLRRPSLDVVRVAPDGDGQYGQSIGAIVEESVLAGRHLRSTTDDSDGARVNWTESSDGSVRLRLESLETAGATSTVWLITIPNNSPSLRIDRTLTFRSQHVEAQGLAIISPAVPDGVDPASLARVLNGATYRPEVGPATLEQTGQLLGLLAVNNPELSFSARDEQPDRIVARQEGSYLSLSFLHHLAPGRSTGRIENGVAFKFGWDNHILVARSDAGPNIERRLLASGYYGNAVITPNFGAVLSASMRDYRGSVWSRDNDYALQGYSYVLDDMSVFANTLQKFLERVDRNGVAPEYLLLDGQYGNRQSWDSMANVVHATYTYVSKTGDLDFYRHNEASVKRALGWIRALDTNNDGLPDRDIFPYGYTDTVENGPMHTYAIAKFYEAFLAMAELEDAVGRDSRQLRTYAETMRTNFRRPLSAGGYWNPQTGYPIAWKRANGQVFTTFETFGVFEAIRVGLIDNRAQLQSIGTWLDANRDSFLNSNPYPERLMIGGYDLRVKKPEVPQDKLWIMDSNAPWITGISVPARVRLGRLEDARAMLDVYAGSANRSTPHAEFGAGPLGVFGAGETSDGGRLWDNWSWFSAIYGSHFGLKMTPQWLEVAPAPLDPTTGSHLSGVIYQGASIDMALTPGGYVLTVDQPKRIVLKPPYGYRTIDVNGDGDYQPVRTVTNDAGVSITVQGYR